MYPMVPAVFIILQMWKASVPRTSQAEKDSCRWSQLQWYVLGTFCGTNHSVIFRKFSRKMMNFQEKCKLNQRANMSTLNFFLQNYQLIMSYCLDVHVQSNLFTMDTKGTGKSVCIKDVSILQRKSLYGFWSPLEQLNCP